jgi:methylated-DNA-protein-cysteine methyltransferase related protein
MSARASSTRPVSSRAPLTRGVSTSAGDDRVQRIRATIDSIPRGRVATYGQIAREAGLPRHARLVGRVLRELESGTKLAWYRVVNAQGRISVRANGEPSPEQRRRLVREGVRFEASGRVDLERHGWRP